MGDKFQKKVNTVTRLACAFMVLFFAMSLFVPGSIAHADGYESWIRGTTQHPGTSTTGISKVDVEDEADVNSAADDAEPNTITKILAEGVGYIGTALRKGFQGNGQIDASITGIIMGHIVNGKSIFVFDLTDENVWGKVGATLYVAIRAIAIVVLFVAVTAQVVVPLWQGNSRGGAIVKNALLTFVLGIFIITVMPLIVDWVCTVRDELGVVLYDSVKKVLPAGKTISYTNPITGATRVSKVDQSLGNTIEGMYYDVYTSQPNIVNAILYLVVCALPLAFIISYCKLAVIQTVMFGLFPLFAFVGTMDKGETIKKWLVTFVTNALVPCLDMVLIFLPSLVLTKIMESGAIEPTNLIILIILVVILFGIVPVRNMILGLFGNGGNWGLEKGHTLGGMLAAAAGVAAGAIMGAKGMIDDYKKGTEGASKEDLSNAQAAEKNLGDEVNPKATEDTAEKSDSKGLPGSDSSDSEQNERDVQEQGTAENGGSEESESDGTHQETSNEITSDEADIERMQADNEAIDNAEANAETSVENTTNSYGNDVDVNAGDTSDASGGQSDNYSSDDLVDKLSVDREDMEKLADTDNGGNNLAKEINENSYVDKKNGIDHSNFNMSRAANLQSMENMSGAIKDIDKQNAALNKAVASSQADMNNARKELNNLYKESGIRRDENGNFDKRDIEARRSSDKEFAAKADGHINAINTARDKIDDTKAQIASNNADKAVLQSEIGRRQDVEKSYASRYAETGRTGQTFSSVADLNNQLKKEERARNIVNFSNYKDEQFKGVLSDSQRIQFQREAAKREASGKLVEGVARVATVAATVPLALASGDSGTAMHMLHTAASKEVAKATVATASGVASGVGRVASGVGRVAQRAGDSYQSLDSSNVNYMMNAYNRKEPKLRATGRVVGGGTEDKVPTPQNRSDTGVDTTTYENRHSRREDSGVRTEKFLGEQGDDNKE